MESLKYVKIAFAFYLVSFSLFQSSAGAGPEYERFLARTKTVEQKQECNVLGFKNSFLK